MLWDSLTVGFQLEIIIDEYKLKTDLEYDGVKLLYQILKEIDPSTTTEVVGFKGKIESKTLPEFDHKVKKYNTLFADTRMEITKLGEDGGYNKYIQYMFTIYITSKNEEFVETVKVLKIKDGLKESSRQIIHILTQ